MKIVISAMLIAACLAATGCGKKGDLEAPSFQGLTTQS